MWIRLNILWCTVLNMSFSPLDFKHLERKKMPLWFPKLTVGAKSVCTGITKPFLHSSRSSIKNNCISNLVQQCIVYLYSGFKAALHRVLSITKVHLTVLRAAYLWKNFSSRRYYKSWAREVWTKDFTVPFSPLEYGWNFIRNFNSYINSF